MKRVEIQECKMELIYLMNEAKHAYQGIELLYMIDKEAEIRTDVTFTMKENDIGRDPDRRDLHHEGKRYDCLVILVWVSVSIIVMSLMSVLSRTSSREHIFCLLHRSKSEQIPP